MRLKLPNYGRCFVCGDQNPQGLGVRFTWDGDRVRTEYSAPESRAGYRGVVHGGILTALVDETMGWAASVVKRRLCVAAELTVRFVKPAVVGRKLLISAWLARDRGRLFEAEGEIRDEDGTLLATSKGKFIPFAHERSAAIATYLHADDECWPVEELFGASVCAEPDRAGRNCAVSPEHDHGEAIVHGPRTGENRSSRNP